MKMVDTSMNISFNWSASDTVSFHFLRNRSSRMIRWRLVACAVLVGVLFGCSAPQTTQQEQHDSTYASLDPAVRYVGMNTCKQCHADHYNTFIRTGMGQSFGLANHQKTSARFSSSTSVHDQFSNLWYHPYWINDSLLIREYRLSGNDTIFERNESVSFIVGSGQHTNSHLQWRNGYLFQVPLTYYTQKGTWDLPPGFENGKNSRFNRRIELECISCHNGYPQLVEGSENKYKQIPLGIDCERCHGPGAKHVTLKQQGILIDTASAIDFSIVNPAKLPIDKQLDLCQRCHVQGNAVLVDGKSFFDFRPGMKLSDVMDVYMPVYKGQEQEHIMASHAERLKLSACFLVSRAAAEMEVAGKDRLHPYRNALTCITCHNPHVSVKETGAGKYNTACKNCHNPGNQLTMQKECTASATSRKNQGDNCVSCHMPKNGTIDIPHVTTTDHFIRKPVSAEYSRQVREFITLACINNPKAVSTSKGKAYLNYYEKFVHQPAFLDSAKKYLPDATSAQLAANYDVLIRWAFLKTDYAKVVELVHRKPAITNKVTKEESAWTYYRIAESYEQLGDEKQAMENYRNAVDLLPFQLSFRVKYASLLESAGQNDAAVAQYRFVLTEDPQNTTALVDYGYLLLTAYNRLSAADSLYDLALSQDPDHLQALLNKTGTSVMLGDPTKAKIYLNRALKIAPTNQQAQRMKASLRVMNP